MSLLADWRPRAEERKAAQEVVSSVVVLREGEGEVLVTWMRLRERGRRGCTRDLQFGEDAIEGGTGAAGDGKG